MPQTQLATRVDARVKKAIEILCRDRGLKMSWFIEEALIDKLEELEDIDDIKKIRHDPVRSLSEVIRDLKLNDKL